MKKLPEVTLSDWIEAEKSLTPSRVKPAGSITSDQYAEMRGISSPRARRVLCDLFRAGKVMREEWNYGHGISYVYWLK